MAPYCAFEATGVLHPVQSLVVLTIVVALGEETVALDPARRVEHELVELHETQSKPRGLRLGQDADTCVDLIDIALVHDLELARQVCVTTCQLQERRNVGLAQRPTQIVVASCSIFALPKDVE